MPTKRSERRGKPRVSRARWSTRLTRVGATVQMEAELTGNDVADDALEPVAKFTIHEYSGKPPHLGGGFRIEKVDSSRRRSTPAPPS